MWVTSQEFEAANENFIDVDYYEQYDQGLDTYQFGFQMFCYVFVSLINNGGFVDPQNDRELLSRLPCVEYFVKYDFGLERIRLLAALIMDSELS